MAQGKGLNCLEKRDLLNQPVAASERLHSWGRRYEEEGLVHDAVNFYERADAKEDIERLVGVALEEGDAFLFRRLCRILNREASREEWLRLARQAEKLGKSCFAAEAYRQGGEEPAASASLAHGTS